MKKLTIVLVLAMAFVGLAFLVNAQQNRGTECKGDFDKDGQVTFDDIDPFLKFMKIHNHEQFWTANVNDDDFVDQRDIDGFVALVTGQAQPVCR